jgi:hypothetical protein
MSVKPEIERPDAVRAKRLRILWIVLGSLVLCCLLGIAARVWIGYRKRAQAMLWYRPRSEAPAGLQWQRLDPARIHRVLEDRQREAIERLEEVQVVELTAEQAAEYVGEPLPDVPGARPYLVRSLVKFLPGTYTVDVADGHLGVWHNSLGRGYVEMGRRAIVLQLDRKPEEVYVSAAAAQ